ncbi:MAG: alpha/beta hydrolase [Microgenomates group bacterium]
MLKPFLIYIHGGTTFKKRAEYLNYLKNKKISLEEPKNWSGDYLDEKLKNHYRLIRIKMPLKENAKYKEWKIVFEKYLELLKQTKTPVVFLGFSLGAIFLVKYFSESKVDLNLSSIHLVAPPFDDKNSRDELSGGFKLRKNLKLFSKQFKNIYFYFSKNDQLVTKYHCQKYQKNFPQAKFFIFKNKNGHFQVEKFPELIFNLFKSL